jgi:hypothetical protein
MVPRAIPPKLKGVWKYDLLGILSEENRMKKNIFYGSADHVCAEAG